MSRTSGSSASRPSEADDTHADALTLTATGAARAASAAGFLESADDDGVVTAATANAFVIELRGKDLDPALVVDAARRHSHDESDDESQKEEAMVVARAASAAVAARAAASVAVAACSSSVFPS